MDWMIVAELDQINNLVRHTPLRMLIMNVMWFLSMIGIVMATLLFSPWGFISIAY